MKFKTLLRTAWILSLSGSLLGLGIVACKTMNERQAASEVMQIDSAKTSELVAKLKDQGYTIVPTNNDPIDFSFFKKWDPATGGPDDDDQIKEHELESELWAAIHDSRTMTMNKWLFDAAAFLSFAKSGDARFPRLNVVQPFGCLRSFADGYYNLILDCAWLEGEQGWRNAKNGRVYSQVLPFTDAADAKKPLSTNINSWVMRYSMVSFRHLVMNRPEEAIRSLEYQVRLGVEGKASAAFSYAIIRHDAKIRILMPDGRLLTPLERSLDILDNCDDKAADWHNKTCRHASPLAPHKFSGMLFSLAEIQGRAAAVLKKPEIDPAELEREKAKLKVAMNRTLELLKSTETTDGYLANLDPAIKAFAASKNITLNPWPYAKQREHMVATLPQKVGRWIGQEGTPILNYVGLVTQPLPEYTKGEACIMCHYQGNETFEAGYKPQW
jgi:hypothetical protein